MIKGVLLTAVLGYTTVVLLLHVFQRNLMYAPGGAPGTPADAGVPEMTTLTARAKDGIETVSWIAPSAGQAETVVLFHGNAGNIADRAFKARCFLDVGFGVVLAGYRGFGGNPGSPTEAGLFSDAMALVEALGAHEMAPGQLILYGESMGSGVAVHMAQTLADAGTPVAGVILEAPFTSMADAAAYHYRWLPARLLVHDRYDSLSKIGGIRTRLLLIHGDRDRTVPQALGKKLFSRAVEPKSAIWLEGAGHVNVFDFGVAAPVIEWLKKRTGH